MTSRNELIYQAYTQERLTTNALARKFNLSRYQIVRILNKVAARKGEPLPRYEGRGGGRSRVGTVAILDTLETIEGSNAAKAYALRSRGWPYDQIARHLQVSIKAIYQYLWRERKRRAQPETSRWDIQPYRSRANTKIKPQF